MIYFHRIMGGSCPSSIPKLSPGSPAPAAAGHPLSEEEQKALKRGHDPAADHSLFAATGRIFNRNGNPVRLVLSDYSIDAGIPVDIPLTKDASFYDRAGLVELIHNTR